MRKAVEKLRGILLEKGRKDRTYVVNTSHCFRGHGKTKAANQESTMVVFYTKDSPAQIRDYLKTYCGLEKDQVEKLRGLKSRWVCLSRVCPKYWFSQHEAGILS